MLEDSTYNELKVIPNFIVQEAYNFYKYNETNGKENLPQENNMLMTKRGRKSSKTNEIVYKVHGRESPDNIRRKIKTHFHNFMIALLNMKIRPYLPSDERFGKISFKITQDLTIEYNQKLFETKIKDIIIAMSNKYSNKNMNKYILNQIMKKVTKNSEVIFLLNLSYKELYTDHYLKSNKYTFEGEEEDESYEAHLAKLNEKFGNKYTNDFKNIAESLIDFFTSSKKRETKKKLIAPSFVNLYDSVINYNNKVNELNIIPKIHKSYYTDKGTQTDAYFTDDEDSFA